MSTPNKVAKRFLRRARGYFRDAYIGDSEWGESVPIVLTGAAVTRVIGIYFNDPHQRLAPFGVLSDPYAGTASDQRLHASVLRLAGVLRRNGDRDGCRAMLAIAVNARKRLESA